MTKAVFPGTFDPATNGHINIIERASGIFDSLVVLVADNSAKKSFFTLSERVEQLRHVTAHLKNVEVADYSGLTAEFAKKAGADVIIRGVRNGTDFDYELQMAEANKKAGGIETVFMSAAPEFAYLSSTIVKEFFSRGGGPGYMVHEYILQKLSEKADILSVGE